MAVSMGILINELVSNACKYAYADGEAGEVRVRFEGDGAHSFTLTVEDDGSGFDASHPPTGTGLGSQIIRIMAESLGANSRCTIWRRASGCRSKRSPPDAIDCGLCATVRKNTFPAMDPCNNRGSRLFP
jgi:nitrate/nitrite-specific signal transduction histidine kinase